MRAMNMSHTEADRHKETEGKKITRVVDNTLEFTYCFLGCI